jgi:hypothetical protein
MKKTKSANEELKPKLDAKTSSKEQVLDLYDDDIRNVELLIDAHSNDPFEVMYLQTYDDSPMAKEADDIVIRVEVS